MEFDLDDEQRALRDAARAFLEREAPVAYAREMMTDPAGYRPEVWKQMAALGWTALPLPEEHEGLGMGFIALAILLAEMGRVLVPGPYLSTMLAALAIARDGSPEQRARLLPRIARGEATGALGAEPGHLEAREGALFGERRLVDGGAGADIVVVVAHESGSEAGVYLAEPSRRTPVSMMDQTRRAADLAFDGTSGERLAASNRASIHRLFDLAAVAHAAEMLGAAERVLELSVEYAKTRVQFDRPIGSFQAVKHRAADMLLDVESMRSAVYYAAWALERDHPDAPLAASMAKAVASDGARRVAASGIQIHGGIGFTWEADLHLYFKRAKASEVAFGDATFHRERIARILRERYAR